MAGVDPQCAGDGIWTGVGAIAGGHALDTILFAMVAMVLTAISYERIAAVYASAGSAYTYVGRALNPHLGISGWAAEHLVFRPAILPEQPFRHLAACGVSGTEDQYSHDSSPVQIIWN